VDAGFSHDGHEVGVAIPARQDVEVDVAGDTGSGDSADIEAYVEAVTMVGGADIFFCLASVAHEFDPLGFGEILNAGDMTKRSDHHVPVGVRV